MEGGEGDACRVVRSDRVADVRRRPFDVARRCSVAVGRRRFVGEADRLAARRRHAAAELPRQVPDTGVGHRRLRRPRQRVMTTDWERRQLTIVVLIQRGTGH